ncbi:hypothetical protein C4573_00440 [Candidatus Woesearchaeota archaeon]|nr:MAG: hypothetical protein C4573_00440 [Candidatus Woesearchaeota archaeon]
MGEIPGLRGRDNPKDILVGKLELEHEQAFHLKELYIFIYRYLLEDENFNSYQKDENPEILYYERTDAQQNNHYHIWWRFYKYPYNSKYLRYYLKIDFQGIRIGQKEVIKNGQKFKVQSGDLIIRIEAWLQLDYKDEWQNHWLLKSFDELFRSKIYRQQIESHKIELYKIMYKLQNEIKNFWKLKTLKEMPNPWQPEKGMR